MTLGRIRYASILLAAVFVASLCWTLRASGAAAAGGQKWALLVGVDKYDSDQISPLKCAGADATALRDALVAVAGFPPDHVIVMTSDSAPDDRPTAIKVLNRLSGFQGVCQPGDEFVFFFSGHGVEQDGESFLLTSDAMTGSTAMLHKSSLAIKEVQQALAEVKATRILKLVDACRNDPRAGRGVGDNNLTGGLSRDLVLAARHDGTMEAAATLFSCKVGQRSYEGYHGHGYFTYFLVQGLKGEAADADGTVTLPGLVKYLERNVAQTVRLRVPGKEQVPWLADTFGSASMSWVLATPGRGAVALQPTRPPASVAVPQREPAPAPVPRPAAPPKVSVTSPAAGSSTSKARVTLAATVSGSAVTEVTVSVNGQTVALGKGSLVRSGHGALVNVAVPLEMGENTIVVAALGSSGEPAQQVVTVERVAAAAPVVVPQPAAEPVEAAPAPQPAHVAMVNPGSSNEAVNQKDGSVLRRIPGGSFTMGGDGQYDGKPAHSVTLAPYWIGKVPVTNAQFRRFVSATGHKSAGDWTSYAGSWGEQAPVVDVSWHDATAYCQWAGLRLPTEAEWEFAARGTDGRAYPWGNEWDASRCRNSFGTSSGGASPVGGYANGASPFGCLDMAGNVWQWCSSKYKLYPYSASDGREDPGGNDYRVLRGGSWNGDYPGVFRCACRLSSLPGGYDYDDGFRVSRTR